MRRLSIGYLSQKSPEERSSPEFIAKLRDQRFVDEGSAKNKRGCRERMLCETLQTITKPLDFVEMVEPRGVEPLKLLKPTDMHFYWQKYT